MESGSGGGGSDGHSNETVDQEEKHNDEPDEPEDVSPLRPFLIDQSDSLPPEFQPPPANDTTDSDEIDIENGPVVDFDPTDGYGQLVSLTPQYLSIPRPPIFMAHANDNNNERETGGSAAGPLTSSSSASAAAGSSRANGISEFPGPSKIFSVQIKGKWCTYVQWDWPPKVEEGSSSIMKKDDDAAEECSSNPFAVFPLCEPMAWDWVEDSSNTSCSEASNHSDHSHEGEEEEEPDDANKENE